MSPFPPRVAPLAFFPGKLVAPATGSAKRSLLAVSKNASQGSSTVSQVAGSRALGFLLNLIPRSSVGAGPGTFSLPSSNFFPDPSFSFASSARRAAAVKAMHFPSPDAAALKEGIAGTELLRVSPKRLGGSLEDYYTHSQLATCIQSPWPFYMWLSWAFLIVVISIGFLLQSNYYFAGRILPKANGNTQLCEDSW
ncbi:transmembrane protein [Cystoisospora suis]|uniref:Transmembrane protein n=1 Tax=Cystoisospora suis TaxID=483139 RepID=A0A2C6KR00_9APIC|nr:transmembrane protein [Cystoisospora suis]